VASPYTLGKRCIWVFDPTTCREILKLRQALGTFVLHAGMEPTNNAAERAIRPGSSGAREALGPRAREAPALMSCPKIAGRVPGGCG
jgi:hypothetical protein